MNKVIYRAKLSMTEVVRKLKDSQGGRFIALADPEILEGEGRLVVLEAASMKIQRVVR